MTFNTSLLSRTSWKRISRTVQLRDGELCQYCGEAAPDGSLDHILPLNHNGRDSLDNLVWCCKRCNAEKQGMTLRGWIIHVRSQATVPIPRPVSQKGKGELARRWLLGICEIRESIYTADVIKWGYKQGFSESLLNRAKRVINLDETTPYHIESNKRDARWAWDRVSREEGVSP